MSIRQVSPAAPDQSIARGAATNGPDARAAADGRAGPPLFVERPGRGTPDALSLLTFAATASRRKALLGGLWAASVALTAASAIGGASPGAPVEAATALAMTALAASVTLAMSARAPASWPGTRAMSWSLLIAASYLTAALLLGDLTGGDDGSNAYAMGTFGVLLTALGVVVAEMRGRIREDAWEVGSDVLLVAGVSGGSLLVILTAGSGAGGSVGHAAVTAAVGAAAAALFAAGAALALWWPSRVRLWFFLVAALLAAAGASVAVGRQYEAGDVSAAAQVLILAGIGAFTIVVSVARRVGDRAGGAARAGGGAGVAQAVADESARPALRIRAIRSSVLVLALIGACVFLGVALVAKDATTATERALLIGGVAALVGLRTLANQRAMTLAHRRLREALGERERAVDSMQAAMVSLQASDQRLRGLLETAVDGVVEIGPGDVVLRVNDAFRTMVGLPSERLVGRTWQDVAEMSGAASELLALRSTGHALIEPDARPLHLEARMSTVPTDPPGTLMLVRDVTASKVAEQTIRTLFQFLQDRDEDRTRYLRRTNVAIEAERNKIARDLHDGPIQGVAAATLSLEAVRLMIGSGQYTRASEMLTSMRAELREETENLRRLMSDLRPPLLEERGLVPAVRELCERFAESTGISVRVQALGTEAAATEMETIAYRVIQEALSNVKKHARARSVVVRIEAAKGSLDVEVEDDGVGFDASEAREHLRHGRVGLASMRERTELGSGTFTLRSRTGAGTTVAASLPLGGEQPSA